MERDFTPPTTPKPEAPQPAPAAERSRLFDRLRKKEKSPAASPEKPAPQSERTPEQPEAPHKQKFGAQVLNVIFGGRKPEVVEPTAEPARESAAETAETTPAAEIDPPVYERATRARRLARNVLAFVMGEAASEPARARAERIEPPLDTEPLTEAAEDLREATHELDATLHEAEEVVVYRRAPVAERIEPSYDGGRPFADHNASERIAERIAKLEARQDATRTVAVVAAGLGVIAVIIAGHEHFSRKRLQREHVKSNKEHAAFKKEVLAEQQRERKEFAALKQEQQAATDRQKREEYYQRLSTFTHTQAEHTRQAEQQLHHAIEEVLPPAPIPQLDQPEVRRAPVATTPELPMPLEPLRRVETTDIFETSGQGQSGNAGNGFFGGGMAGIGGKLQQAIGQVGKAIKPPSKADLEAEAQRKAKLDTNAWLYTVGFVIAVTALVLSLIFAG